MKHLQAVKQLGGGSNSPGGGSNSPARDMALMGGGSGGSVQAAA
ncbi:hypothetical protein HDF16_000839 [Granulicella aggregans]|uniref:Uncharacterized protein n=1 Tax=Granulicella aggregans TaxID=474949 RepID=A0A7W7ZA89_9BACT|nr:hypothetical protein [Granulicella aggregans]MBB5056170.1 hypothetical protein [Granulicella aggregans]